MARTGRVPPNALRTPHRAAIARALLARREGYPLNSLLVEVRDLPLRPSELAEITRELPPIGPLPKESSEDPSELPPLSFEEGCAVTDASLLVRAWRNALQRWPDELEHAPRDVLGRLAEPWPESEIEVVLHGEREARRRLLAPEARERTLRQERGGQARPGDEADAVTLERVHSRLMSTAERLAPFVAADERQGFLAAAAAHAGPDPTELTAEQLRDVAAWCGLDVAPASAADPMELWLTDGVVARGVEQLQLAPGSSGAVAYPPHQWCAHALLWLHRIAPWRARELDVRIRDIADHPARDIAELCARYPDEASLERALAPLGWRIVGGFGDPVTHLHERLSAIGVTTSSLFVRDEACDVGRALHAIASTSPTLRAYVFDAGKDESWGPERLRAHGPGGAFRSNEVDLDAAPSTTLCAFLNAILSRVGAPERIYALDGPALAASHGFGPSFDASMEYSIGLRPDELEVLCELGIVDRRS